MSFVSVAAPISFISLHSVAVSSSVSFVSFVSFMSLRSSSSPRSSSFWSISATAMHECMPFNYCHALQAVDASVSECVSLHAFHAVRVSACMSANSFVGCMHESSACITRHAMHYIQFIQSRHLRHVRQSMPCSRFSHGVHCGSCIPFSSAMQCRSVHACINFNPLSHASPCIICVACMCFINLIHPSKE